MERHTTFGAALAITIALSGPSATARADQTTGFVVTVPPPPVVGALSAEELDTYFNRLRASIRLVEARVVDGRDGPAELDERALSTLREYLIDERERLMEPDTSLRGLGIGLTSLGGAAIVTALTVGLLSPLFGDARSDAVAVAVASGIGGGVALGAGIPMIVVGHRGHPRPAPSREAIAVPMASDVSETYLGLRVAF